MFFLIIASTASSASAWLGRPFCLRTAAWSRNFWACSAAVRFFLLGMVQPSHEMPPKRNRASNCGGGHLLRQRVDQIRLAMRLVRRGVDADADGWPETPVL